MESRLRQQLAHLSSQPAFSTHFAESLGISRRMLSYWVQRGEIERVSRGLYRAVDDRRDLSPVFEDLVTAAMAVPGSVVCLISALDYYEMTLEIPREIWLAIPHEKAATKRSLIRSVRMRNTDLGRTSVPIGGCSVSIFDRERTIIDAFRLLDLETALYALRTALTFRGNKKIDLAKLHRYARVLRVNITPYIQALTI